MKYTEAKLEQSIIDLLGQEGIPHLSGETITRDPDEVLIKQDLQDFLLKKYQAEKLTELEVASIVRRLEAHPVSDIYESNKAIMKLVSDGFVFKTGRPHQKGFVFLLNILSNSHQIRFTPNTKYISCIYGTYFQDLQFYYSFL